MRAPSSIGANISEGYARGTGKIRTLFFEYALGSSRESRAWYFQGRCIRVQDVLAKRAEILAEICLLLLNLIPAQKRQKLGKRSQ